MKAKPMHPQEPSGQGRGNDERDWDRRHKMRGGHGAIFIGDPMTQINYYSGEKTSFRKAHQKSCGVKLARRSNEGHKNSSHTPNDHNAGDTAARAPAFHQQSSGNLKDHVSQEKDSRAHSENTIAEAQVMRHL